MSKLLSDKEREAKEATLARLRSQLEKQQNTSSSSANLFEEDPNASVNEYDVPDSDYYDNDEEFFDDTQLIDDGGNVCMYTRPMDEFMGKTVKTTSNIVRVTVGDFELLRLAKMGDIVSFKDFASLVHADPTTFQDNHGRNALHYAADSGDLLLLQYLIDTNVPFKQDEKMMTPVDIASLNQHNEAAKLLAESFAEAAEVLKTYEEAVEIFTRGPPKITMARPAPPELKESRPRAFWGEESRDLTATKNAFGVSQLNQAHHKEVLEALSGHKLTRESCGFYNWLPPAESATLAAILPRATVVGARWTANGSEELCGVVIALSLGGVLVDKRGAVRAAAPQLAAQLAVHPAARGNGVAALLMTELRGLLLRGSEKETAVVFRSALQLPVKSVGLLKWFQRSIAPCSVLRRRYAGEVFPDFYMYDDVLRADIIAKNALTNDFRAKKAEHSDCWRAVDPSNTEQIKLLKDFISKHATALFEFSYLPKTNDDLLLAVITNGCFPFMYFSPTNDEVTDIVVLRVRNAVEQSGDTKSAAVCVYAMFTSFKGPEKAEEIIVLAELLKCETVILSNMFGFLDSDLSKAMFEELLSCREYLYVINGAMESVLTPTPLTKVAIPCAFI